MRTVTMTTLNQHPSEVTKLVEAGEVVQVTRHGKPVMRLVPEPTPSDPLGPLVAAGLLSAPASPRRAPHRDRPLRDTEAVDAAIAWLSRDSDA